MTTILNLKIILALTVLDIIVFVSAKGDNVIFVNLLARHGNRTPIWFHKNDPNQHHKMFETLEKGSLLEKGRKQSYNLGVWLRQRYGTLLLDPKKIYVRTTDVERVKESARCCLAAMFPTRGSSANKKSKIAATSKDGSVDCTSKIELHTIKGEDDYILGHRVRCDAYDEEFEKLYSSKEILDKNNAFKNVYATIKMKSGNTGKERFGFISKIYDTVLVERELGLQPDQWAVNIMPEMKKASILSFTIHTWTNTLKRLTTGPLLGQMIKDMEEKVRRKIDLVAKLYYAHDLTIVNLLNTLGVYDMKELPGYAACVSLELIDAGLGKYDVKLYYHQTTPPPQVTLLIHKSLEDFITSTKHLIPLDWHKECYSSSKKGAPGRTRSRMTAPHLKLQPAISEVTVMEEGLSSKQVAATEEATSGPTAQNSSTSTVYILHGVQSMTLIIVVIQRLINKLE